MKIDINGVSITLTKDQLKEIAKQTTKSPYTLDDIRSIEDAEEILLSCKTHKKYIESQFVREKDWNNYQLETIIKAANYLDNDCEEWIANFLDKDVYKYIPWLEKIGSGWVVDFVDGCSYHSDCPVGFYYKNNTTAKLIVNRFIKLYNKVWG